MGHRDRQGSDRSRRKFYKSVCSDCGKECELPFRPKRDRPVYCQECLAKRRSPRTDDRRPREYRRENHPRRFGTAPENVNVQILAELIRIRKALEKNSS